MPITFLTSEDKVEILKLIEETEDGCITGSGAPTTSTKGDVGDLYMDTLTGAVYKCTAVNDSIYTWAALSVPDLTDINKKVSQLSEAIANLQAGLTAAQISALDGMFKIASFTKDPSAEYTAFKVAFGIVGGGDVEPDEPETPDTPAVTLTSISATYSGGSVPVGTAVTALTGIVVTATYSDGSTATVTGYTLSGTIAEGNNTITVSYGGKTTTITVTGVAESGGDETTTDPFAGTWVEGFRLSYKNIEYPTGHSSHDTSDYVNISAHSSITISTDAKSNQYVTAVVWYDNDKTYISGTGDTYIHAASSDYPPSVSYTIPNGAVYCRMCLAGYEKFIISVE